MQTKNPGTLPGVSFGPKLIGQPPQTDRPVQAPRVKFAFSLAVPAALSSAASDTSKPRISISVSPSPNVAFFIALYLVIEPPEAVMHDVWDGVKCDTV